MKKLSLLVVVLLMAVGSGQAQAQQKLTAKARKLQKSILTLDTHTPMRLFIMRRISGKLSVIEGVKYLSCLMPFFYCTKY